MLLTIADAKPTRMVVLSYDIGNPRRARRVRKTLDAVNHAKQYSVHETLLTRGELRRILTDIAACCDPDADLLAVWRPLDGLRLTWQAGQLTVEAQSGAPCRRPATLPAKLGNFILCYDISAAAALRAVAAEVAAECLMVQRSVYWLRASARRLAALMARCANHLDSGDRLWAYPLNASQSLWRLGEAASSVLPIANHRWPDRADTLAA